jgi:hypothetical protein
MSATIRTIELHAWTSCFLYSRTFSSAKALQRIKNTCRQYGTQDQWCKVKTIVIRFFLLCSGKSYDLHSLVLSYTTCMNGTIADKRGCCCYVTCMHMKHNQLGFYNVSTSRHFVPLAHSIFLLSCELGPFQQCSAFHRSLHASLQQVFFVPLVLLNAAGSLPMN